MEEYDAKGLTVLSATSEPKESVEPWVAQNKAAYPILCGSPSGLGSYSTGGVPQAYLIGADGTIVWEGHPGELKEDAIEKHLGDMDKENRVSTWAFVIAQSLPAVPEKLKDVKKLLEKMKFGDALKKAETTVGKLEGEEQQAGEQIRDWIANVGTTAMEKAAGLVREGLFYKAVLQYDQVEERFKGHDLAKQAKAAVKELKADKVRALEIKASEKLEQIQKEMDAERKPEDKLKCLKPLLAKKYADTMAGKEAAKLAEELEKKVD